MTRKKIAAAGVQLRQGKVSVAGLGNSDFFALYHGGAGPQDPGSAKNRESELALERVWRMARENWASPRDHPQFLAKNLKGPIGSASFCLSLAKALEFDSYFNAGRGAALQEDGVARVSASYMDSESRKFSAVINATRLLHPSELALYLQNERFCILDGVGTRNLAKKLKIRSSNLVTEERLLSLKKMQKKAKVGRSGTIGSLVCDRNGKLAAITSTGGVGNETVGRVGDTPMVAGNYCSEDVAVSCTGYGEQIVNLFVAPQIAGLVNTGSTLSHAMRKVMKVAEKRGYSLAAIAIQFQKRTKEIHWVAGQTSRSFIWARASQNFWKSFLQ